MWNKCHGFRVRDGVGAGVLHPLLPLSQEGRGQGPLRHLTPPAERGQLRGSLRAARLSSARRVRRVSPGLGPQPRPGSGSLCFKESSQLFETSLRQARPRGHFV